MEDSPFSKEEEETVRDTNNIFWVLRERERERERGVGETERGEI